MTFTWTEATRPIGDVWILPEGDGRMPGGSPSGTLLQLGYPRRQRFVGTWIGSTMTHLWTCDGALDASGKGLTLDAERPDMRGDGRIATYRDIYPQESDDHRTLTSRMLGEDGEWRVFMRAHLRRQA